MKHHRIRTTLIACLLLAVFSGYNWCVHAFPHIHVIDGARIVHSHPYHGDPTQPDHQHSSSEIITFSVLSHFQITDPVLEPIVFKEFIFTVLSFPDPTRTISVPAVLGHYLRAPPSPFC